MMKTMKKALALAAAALATLSTAAVELVSPDGKSRVTVDVDGTGRPYWSYAYRGRKAIEPSHLGFTLEKPRVFASKNKAKKRYADKSTSVVDLPNMTNGFAIVETKRASFDETWKPVWGEESEIRDRHNELFVLLRQEKQDRLMGLRFRLFDDGVGFRYEFPDQDTLTYFTIAAENTEFRLASDATAWWIPGDYDTQEYNYECDKVSALTRARVESVFARYNNTQTLAEGPLPAVQTALMLKTDDGLYLNLHEAACIDYATMHLSLDPSTLTFTSHLTPDRTGFRGRLQTPCASPWRTVIAGEKATDILASRVTLNLNEPCKIADTSWIRPMKYMGIWWRMILGVSSWSYTGRPYVRSVKIDDVDYSKIPPSGAHYATTENTKRYIDFAAKHGIEGMLVEGWNIGWEDWFHKEKEKDRVFDFVTPYPDFDVAEVSAYAAKKGVKMIMHHETNGSVRNYERCLADAYAFMNTWGYTCVKSGYVGPILPRVEHHYTQWMNNHYLYCITEAAKRRICVNAHESTRPTGICRTWPNWVGNESARGSEYQAFSNCTLGHTAILPFTRLIGGPMDYTPGIFEFSHAKLAPGRSGYIPSTLCGQLALYVTMYSPIQMACDTPEAYERHLDAFRFIVDVPVEWDESRYLAAEPMDHLVVARRQKGKDAWFVGGVTGAKPYATDLSLDFLTPGRTYEAIVYADAPDANIEGGNDRYVITRRSVTAADTLSLKAVPGGGFAVSIR